MSGLTARPLMGAGGCPLASCHEFSGDAGRTWQSYAEVLLGLIADGHDRRKAAEWLQVISNRTQEVAA